MPNQTKGGAVAWMAHNPVAANLLMLFLLIGGFMTCFYIRQEVFPPFAVDMIVISVVYPGTSPEEVEDGIILAVEEAVRDIEGVKRLTATASEGGGAIMLELLSGTDGNKVLQDVKNAVDRVTTLPEEAERPSVRMITMRRNVITIVLYGDQEDRVLQSLAERVRDDLLARPEITYVELAGVRPMEISIEVPQKTLRMYNLTLNDVARMVRAASVDFSAGGVKAESGEILLRVHERREVGLEFADIPIVSRADGTVVRLGDMATIVDGFADTDESASFDGQPAIMIRVFREGDQTPIEVAASALAYIDELNLQIPEGVSLTTFDDSAEAYEDRVNLLMRNALIGMALVLVLLGLFLNARLAFWVTLGIPISFMGAMLFLPPFDVSINIISLFAFIMALGMVVDDAIVVGESIYTLRKQGKGLMEAAIAGTREVSVPVTFAIATNIVAFLPLMFVEGVMGKVFRVIPIVVCLVFIMSLIEALFILPAHLGHSKRSSERGLGGRIDRLQGRISRGLEWAIEHYYKPLLAAALRRRYLTVATGVAVLIVIIGYVAGGRIPVTFSPSAESDVVAVGLELPYGTPAEETKRIIGLLVEAADRVTEHYGPAKVSEGIFAHIGASNLSMAEFGLVEGGHAANIRVFLVKVDERDFTGDEFAARWREEMGDIPGVERIYFQVAQMGPPGGSPIDVELSHRDFDVLEPAAMELAETLRDFSAARDIDDGFTPGKPQLDFRLKPEAHSLGLTSVGIGSQVRAGFYGAEVLRLQRGRDEVKVMVRLPKAERGTELTIEDMLIRTPRGGELPLSEAAEVVRGRAYTAINRTDGRRVINVTADVIPVAEESGIQDALRAEILPRLMEKYPGISYSMGGQQREMQDSYTSLFRNFVIALIAIFVMLGVVFRSYSQPLIIMAAIPFGIVGAVVGHIIMGFSITMVTMLGVVALSGVVLNDSLILIDYANRRRREGASSLEAISDAGARRFRPIMLTTLTTFFALTPMIFETSFQARILVPMAISMGYGILFSTMIILLLVPSLHLIVEDIKKLLGVKEERENLAEQRVS